MRKYLTVNLTVIMAAITVAMCAGCIFTKAQLDPAGVYAGNLFLYNCDKSLVTSQATLDTFVTFEWQNRTVLASNHLQAVTVAADAVRKNAPNWFALASMARTAYTNLLFTVGAPADQMITASNTLALQVISIEGQATAASAIRNSVTQ